MNPIIINNNDQDEEKDTNTSNICYINNINCSIDIGEVGENNNYSSNYLMVSLNTLTTPRSMLTPRNMLSPSSMQSPRFLLSPREVNSVVDPNNSFFKSFLGVPRIPMEMVTLDQKLGNGAFGQVYRGKWGNHSVAVKEIEVKDVIRTELGRILGKEGLLESLRWEVSRLSTVCHPNCVQFYGIYQAVDQGNTYLVMELCTGGTLEKALVKGSSWANRWQWALEMTQGLMYLHQQGILHRDLKAENILLDGLGRAKLADLGVSQIDSLLSKVEAMVVEVGLQDVRFIAPENLKNPLLSNQATDIYALGLVFWQMVMRGEVPHPPNQMSSKDREDWQQGTFFEREPIPEDCLPVWKELIIQCWQTHPPQRPSASQLVHQLQGFLEEFQYPQPRLLETCELIDYLIHPKRLEGLSYRAPYLTQYRVDEPIDQYWRRFEGNAFEEGLTVSEKNAPLDLKKTLHAFLEDSKKKSLLLLGEAGLGKTLTTYLLADELLTQWRTYLSDPDSFPQPPRLPLFIRPSLHAWSHTELTDAFTKALKYYGLSHLPTSLPPLLLILDGYDECQGEGKQANLCQQLGIFGQVDVKVLITCRPDTVPKVELIPHFGYENQLQVYYFLPFHFNQMLSYLNDHLGWNKTLFEKYQTTLQGSESLRTVLRNPFVLSLLAQSWETVIQSQPNWQKMEKWQIYEGFVTHWLTTQKELLSPSLQAILAGTEVTFCDLQPLLTSFQQFASLVAFEAFIQKDITLSTDKAKDLPTPWVRLTEHLQEDSQECYTTHHKTLTAKQKRRALLTQDEYTQIMMNRLEQFLKGSPIKRKLQGYEFSHKSFFEYFAAKRLLFIEKEETEMVSTGIKLLNPRLLQEESEILLFWVEGWEARKVTPLSEALFQIIQGSREHDGQQVAASNAATLLARARVAFSGRDLNGVCIPDADLSRAILDKCHLRGADLHRANLFQTCLCGTDLTQTDLSETNFGELPCLKVQAGVECITHSPDGKWLAVGAGSEIQLWRGDYSERVALFKGHKDKVLSVAFSPNGLSLASGSRDNTVILWEVKNQALKGTLKGHRDFVRSVVFSPNGTLLASGSWDKMVQLWDVENQSLLGILQGHTDKVQSVSFSPDGRYLASGSWDKTILLWEVDSRTLKGTLKGHTSNVKSIMFSPVSGALLVSGSDDKTVCLWEVETLTLKGTLKGHTGYVYSVAFSPDEVHLVSGGEDKTVCLWEVKSQTLKGILKGHKDDVNTVTFSPDGIYLLSGGDDSMVRLWMVETQTLKDTLQGHLNKVSSVTFSPDGVYLASGSWDKTIQLWEVQNQSLIATLLGHTNYVYSVAFSPNGVYLASGSWDKSVRLWEVETQSLKGTLLGHTMGVNSVVFNHDGRYLVSASDDNTVRLWEVDTQTLISILQGHTSYVISTTFSPNGALLASSGRDSTVRLWDIENPSLISTIKVDFTYCRCVFSPNGKLLATGNADHTLWLWEVETQSLIGKLKGHTGPVWSVVFSPDGGYLASGGEDKTVRLWEVESQTLKSTLHGHMNCVQSVAFSPDGVHLASGSADFSICLWSKLDPLHPEQWLLIYRFSNSTVLLAENAFLKGAKISGRNLQLLKECGANDDQTPPGIS